MVERSTSTSDEISAYQRVAAAIDATLQLAAQEEEIAPTGENYFGFIYLRIFESYDFFCIDIDMNNTYYIYISAAGR